MRELIQSGMIFRIILSASGSTIFERYRSLIEIKNFEGEIRSIITSNYTSYSGIMLERYFKQKLAESKQFRAIGSWWEHKERLKMKLIL